MVGHGAQNLADVDEPARPPDQMPQGVLGQPQADLIANELRLANDALQGAVQFANVGIGHGGDVARHVLAQGNAAAGRLALQDGHPHRLAGRLDLHMEATAKA